jgi:transcriptional regulator with PAS, ATPase and Fis domain
MSDKIEQLSSDCFAAHSSEAAVLSVFADMCEAISKVDLRRAKELLASIQNNVCPKNSILLARAFSMMLVKVEEREFERKNLTAECLAVKDELERLRRQRGIAIKGVKARPGRGLPDIVGISSSMREIRQLVERFSQVKATVLISGETGTGKSVIARMMHFSGERAKRPFVSVNAAAVPGTLLESELFGIEKGVASGVTARMGRFEQANTGTIFLDEIGDMPLESQAKLLHVIENSEVERVGGRGAIPVDVRIIAASNRDLADMCEEGRFRPDLYYRLNVLRLHIPPLRERPEDIPVLARHFLDKRLNLNANGVREINHEALYFLVQYKWPGNIRELEHEIERADLLARSPIITPQDLSPNLCDSILPLSPPPVLPDPVEGPLKRMPIPSENNGLGVRSLKEMELETVKAALAEAGGNKTKAAQILGISREGFRKMLKRLGIP